MSQSSALVGKVAIVSGAGRGIGQALAIRLAREGAAVVVNDLDEAAAHETTSAIEAFGGKTAVCIGNVTETDFGERFIDRALGEFGGIDIVVNNAGYYRDGMIQNQSDAQFQEMLDIHVIAPFRILRAAAEPLRIAAKREAAEGREIIRKVVNISSMAGTHGHAGQVNYSSAKAALVGMTKTLAKEWGRLKVCVNCVAFGVIETRLTHPTDGASSIQIGGNRVQAGLPATALTALTHSIPLGRVGRPDEAAGAAYFFCSPDSDYVSGEVLVVAGGLSI